MGGEGTGKGMFFKASLKNLGKNQLLVSDINEIVGNFNASLERNLIICMDEALFKGDKRAQDKLKSIVTEQNIRIEQKYEPRHTIQSFHRFCLHQ